jgi:iron-sulfur cluster repair protein YtfE (RIC family)
MSTTTTRTLEATVGELVTECPGRARIFEALGIDYCCGGKKPLAQAIREKALDEKFVLRILDAFDTQSPRPSTTGLRRASPRWRTTSSKPITPTSSGNFRG